MSDPTTARPKSSKPPLSRAFEPGKPVPQETWPKILLIALLASGMVIGAVVWFTPKPADDPALVQQLKEQMKLDVGNPSPPLPAAQIQLPDKPSQVSDEQLFESLQLLADQAIERLPNEPAALHIAALIHSELKKTSAAESLWRKCLALNPRYPGPFIGLADLLLKLGRAEEAAQLLEEHWSLLSAWPDAARLRARILDQLGETEQAVTILESNLRLHGAEADSWLQLGQLQNEMGSYQQAEESFRTAVALGMTANPTLIFALSTSVSRQNRADEARQLLDKFQELKRSEADPSGNRFQESYSVALRKIAVRAMFNASAMYNELGRTVDAEKIVMQLLALDPYHVSGLMTLSSILRRSGRLADALVVQKRILELEPDNPLNVINLASVWMDLGAVHEAEEFLKQAAERAPSNSGLLHAELAKVYLNFERFAEARSFAREAIRRQPNKNAYSLLAAACKALDDKGGLFEALTAIEQLERSAPSAAGSANVEPTQ